MIILWSIFVAVLAYEVVYSDLALYVKKALYLDKYYPQIELISFWNFYKKFCGKYLYILFPLAILIMILANTHRFLYKLLQCPYCLSIWIGVMTGLIISYPIPLCILLAFTGSFITSIYVKLRQ